MSDSSGPVPDAHASFGALEAPVAPPGEDDLPCDDGMPLETERHYWQIAVLIESLDLAWKDRNDFYVGGNMFIYFSEHQIKRNDFRGPDVFVVLDTVKREHKSWVVWQENGRTPNVVIELLSPSTESVDRGEKMRVYAQQLRVGEYYLYDPIDHRLEGYRLDSEARRYVRMVADPNGDLAVKQLGLTLGVRPTVRDKIEAPMLRWITADGRVLEHSEERAQIAMERERIATEAARTATEAARTATERARTATETARHATERADREAARADEAQRRIAELEAELRSRSR